ncbi:MAG: hypothetical protein IPG25_16380 [Proteobacteria bacterium]|nr:hypothetical protein [Pseudomonadota bacterium]
MAVIVFYEATKMDEHQLAEGLQSTDHHWEFVRDQISLRNLNEDAEVISVFVTSQVTRQMIEKMPRLKLIATRSTGFDHIDLEAATARGVTVLNVPTYGENTVAEAAFTDARPDPQTYPDGQRHPQRYLCRQRSNRCRPQRSYARRHRHGTSVATSLTSPKASR